MFRFLLVATILLGVTACTNTTTATTPTPTTSVSTPTHDQIQIDPANPSAVFAEMLATGPFAQQFGLNKLARPLDVDCLVEHGWEQCDIYGQDG